MTRSGEIKERILQAAPAIFNQIKNKDNLTGSGRMTMRGHKLIYDKQGEFVGSGYCIITAGVVEHGLLKLGYDTDHRIRGIVIANGDSQETDNLFSHALLEITPLNDPGVAMLIDMVYRQKNFYADSHEHCIPMNDLETYYPAAVIIRQLATGAMASQAEKQCTKNIRLSTAFYSSLVEKVTSTTI